MAALVRAASVSTKVVQSSWSTLIERYSRSPSRVCATYGVPSSLSAKNDNRGNFTEITSSLPHSEYLTKTINYMSIHRDSYPALADSAAFEGIRNLEAGYNRHMYPYINKRNLYKKDLFADLRDGDIVCLTTKIDGLDVSHLGIVRFVKGKIGRAHV